MCVEHKVAVMRNRVARHTCYVLATSVIREAAGTVIIMKFPVE